MNYKEDYKLIFVAACRVSDHYIYASSDAFNGLFKVDINTKECEFVDVFPGEKLDEEHLFFSACCCEKKVFFSPQRAKSIHVYDLITHEFTIIDIRVDAYRAYNREYKFGDIFCIDHEVYCIGAHYPAIIQINTSDLSTQYYDIYSDNNFLFRKAAYIPEENSIYAISCKSNILMKFDVYSKCVEIINMPENFHGSWNIATSEDGIWCSPRSFGDPFIKYDFRNNEFCIIPYSIEEKEITNDKALFLYSFFHDGIIYSIPQGAPSIVRIDVEKKILQTCKLNIKELQEEIGYCFRDREFIYYEKKTKEGGFLDQDTIDTYRIDTSRLVLEKFAFTFSNWEEYLHSISELKVSLISNENIDNQLGDLICWIKLG